MFRAKFVAVVVVVTLWLSESNFHFQAYGDALGDVKPTPTSCENCQTQQVTPPLAGYPSYGAPSPPQLSPPPSGYSIYGAPPPPHKTGESKCPPAPTTGTQCCTPPAPYTYGSGYGPPTTYYGPPTTYYAPPNPYTYVPNGEAQGPASMILTILAPLMMFFFFLYYSPLNLAAFCCLSF